ncbi:MAG: hypothetical protein M0Z50_11805 [Planctomycetia bacterium]|nr:hypothetical protein [Planctomycetia bacterium]
MILAVVSLTPFALYLIGRLKDPFHPLTLAGVLAFGIADLKLLQHPGPALNFVTTSSIVEFELIAATSLLFMYLGWHWRSRLHPTGQPTGTARKLLAPDAYHPLRLLACGWLMAILTFTSWLLARQAGQSFHFSGYLGDWGFLQTAGAVLLLQAFLLDRNLFLFSLIGLGVDLFGCVYSLYAHGARHSAAILLTVLAVPFVFKGTRPKKVWVLILGLMAAIAMMTLAETRTIVGKGEAPNRFAALWLAGERFIHGGRRHYGAGLEFVVGSMEVQVVQQQQNWNFGRVIPDIAVMFLPYKYFPNKYAWISQWDAPHFFPLLRRYLGLTKKKLSYGVAPTGFADAYVNFWWLFPLFWLLVGYFLQRIYTQGVYGRRLDHQGYLLCTFMVLFLMVGQDLEAGIFQGLFTLPPIWIAYKYARDYRARPGIAPAYAGQGAATTEAATFPPWGPS